VAGKSNSAAALDIVEWSAQDRLSEARHPAGVQASDPATLAGRENPP
jgi:hypothetical protein